MPELSGGWNELSPESIFLQDTYAPRNTIGEADDIAGISSDAQQSFCRADLVIAAADDWDTNRAFRNAGLLTRLTAARPTPLSPASATTTAFST